MKLLVALAALVAISTALVLRKPDQLDGPKCGLVMKTFGRRVGNAGANVVCEMCLDLVEIAEMYEDCDESYVEKKLDEKCDSYFHSGVVDDICRGMIDGLYKFVKTETDKNPASVCTKLLKHPCQYA